MTDNESCPVCHIPCKDFVKDIEKLKLEEMFEQLFHRLNIELRMIYFDLEKYMKQTICDVKPARKVASDDPRHNLTEIKQRLSNILGTSFNDLREQNTLAKFRLVEQLMDTINQL